MSRNPASKTGRNGGVPDTLASIPLTDPHAISSEASLGELVKEASTQVSALLRAEVELARAEITSDVRKSLTGSVFFISALVVLFYSTFFFFFFIAALLDVWLKTWAAYLIVFALMSAVAVGLAVLGFLKVRRIRGPRETIASVKETREALRPDLDGSRRPPELPADKPDTAALTDPSGW